MNTARSDSAGSARAPLALRLAVTGMCDMQCVYCTPGGAACAGGGHDRVALDELRWLVQTLCAHLPVAKVHLTGGEPLLREGLPALIRALAAAGIPDVALTTNGQRLAALAGALAHAGLRRVNVSLDSLRPDVYARITRGGQLQPVLDGIAAARAAGMQVKLNMVVMRGWNDEEIESHAQFALAHGCDLRFLELMPIGCARDLFARAYVPAANVQARLARLYTLEPHAPRAGAHRQYQLRNGSGAQVTAGFIASVSEPFCAGCRRVRLTADGRLLGCLARPAAIDIVPLLRARDEAGVLGAIGDALRHKRADASFDQPVSMVDIGG